MVKLKKEVVNTLKKKGFSDYQISVYKVVACIPCGRTRSYKWVARRTKTPCSCRAVGQALKENPYPAIIPCHRVIKSDGSIGGFSRGRVSKMRLLKSEGIDIINTNKGYAYDRRYKRCPDQDRKKARRTPEVSLT